MNFGKLRKEATIRRARQTSQVIRSPTPIKTPDYFFGDFFSDEELDGAKQQNSSEPAGQPIEKSLPSQRPTNGGKTVNEDYYKTLERQAEEYQKQDEAPGDERKSSTTVIPLDRLFEDDELDADVFSSDPAPMNTSSPTAEAGDTTPISTPDYFFEDEDTIPAKTIESDILTTTPVASSPAPEAEVEEDLDWYQYPARPGESSGRWTPEYAHARRAPRINGRSRTIWVERSKTFFSFPPEVRQRIYKYALFPKGIEAHAPCPYFSASSTWKVKTPALLRTAFDVRREAMPYYYSEVRMACTEPVFAKMWLSKIGKEARMALGGVTVRFDDGDKKNTTVEQQRLRFFLEFRAAGVEVRKDIIQVR